MARSLRNTGAAPPRPRLANSPLARKLALDATRLLGRSSASLAALPADVLWFTPWRVPVSDRGLAKQARWLENVQRLRIPTDVGRVSVFTQGEGPTVLLVHGWGEDAAGLGGFIEPLVARGYRVVGIDLPAHGRSDKGRTNIIEAAAAIHAVADHFGGAEAIVAHSLGGHATLWALKHGFETRKVVLLAPNADPSYALAAFEFMFALPAKAMAGLRGIIERRFGPNVWEELRAEVLASGLTTPALIFHDPADPQVPFEGSVRLAEAWSSAALIETPGLGHRAITRDPDVLERATSFIARERADLAEAP